MLDNNKLQNPRDQIPALKLAKECDEAAFNLFSQGPSIMNIKALEERVNRIESYGEKQTSKQTI